AGAAGEREEREGLGVGCLELEGQAAGEVELRDGRDGALGVRQRVRDRHAHVRIAEVREHGAVAEAHQRVYDGRRMDDDLYPLVRQAEQEVRLDQLESRVRERGGIDRGLRADSPRRVGVRVLRGDSSGIVECEYAM